MTEDRFHVCPYCKNLCFSRPVDDEPTSEQILWHIACYKCGLTTNLGWRPRNACKKAQDPNRHKCQYPRSEKSIKEKKKGAK